MVSLLVLVFVIELVAHLINTIGAATVSNLLWNLYLVLPTQTSKQAAEKKKIQKEYLTIRRDLNATSSQDQFAKWAKLRRQHDKLLEQLEKLKSTHDATKAKFESTVGAIRWLTITGLRFGLPFWYAKQPMFWLPQGWFPYYVEWILSFPRAPLGSISIASWQTACIGVIMLVSDTITAILGLAWGAKMAQKQPTKAAEEKKGPTPTEIAKASKVPSFTVRNKAKVATMISWGTIKSLLIFFGPLLLPKAIGYYRSIRDASRNSGLPVQPAPAKVVRSLCIIGAVALVFLARALPLFAPENVFARTQSRLQIPTDVLFNRLSSLRPAHVLTAADAALRAKFVSLESRLLYLQYGPAALADCPFCASDDPTTYFVYALPALLAPHLLNLVVLSLATCEPAAGRDGPRWRTITALACALAALLDLYAVGAYNPQSNARATRLTELDAFFWRARTRRYLGLAALDGAVGLLLWLSSTNRAFARPPTPAERVDGVTRQLLATKGRLNAVGIVKNTAIRDEELRARAQAYWQHEGRLMRDVMEDRDVVEGVNDALQNRINIQDITRDAETYALHMLPRLEEAPPETTVG
ncbi:CHD5-like protein-domain-containing protein [Xylariaceae sp. FL0662B]|nr:CHD5-like protein-domain-containing protein [Xylariaceae sp. FL0662B]